MDLSGGAWRCRHGDVKFTLCQCDCHAEEAAARQAVVVFKSYPENWVVEASGLKNNTVRIYEADDLRFDLLKQFVSEFKEGVIPITPLFIKIISTETNLSFLRKVRHVCQFGPYFIITWEP